ncbi:murein L,D-transpeptidase catalytic domain family protein [Novosphingobium soli]|uniref:Murein L,D-transpeptidase catalytic domain family protein n=1 Tax=Novosphingobium soli TaxID=574956 RepID=A0ABV6CQF3_9SPHN
MVEHRLHSSRRALMISGATLAVGALARSTTRPILAPPARAVTLPQVPAVPRSEPASSRFAVEPRLLERALAALDRHAARIKLRDRIAVVDFTAPSAEPRLHFLDVVSGKATRLLVAHGSGSDPGHTGYLKSFSNAFGSNASCEGAFLASDYYVGRHGRSQRLLGLDPTNSNALDRAIVVHSAWYANDDMIAAHGKLGRSQGCFAVGEDKLDDVFGFLGQGRMIYAARA